MCEDNSPEAGAMKLCTLDAKRTERKTQGLGDRILGGRVMVDFFFLWAYP